LPGVIVLTAGDIGQADLVQVPDAAVGQGHEQRLAYMLDTVFEGGAVAHRVEQHAGHDHQEAAIADDLQALPLQVDGSRLSQSQVGFRVVAHQATRETHLVHDGVAGVDAQSAGDALVLKAIADVDTGRTNLHAEVAVDAVAVSQCLALGQGAQAGARRHASRGTLAAFAVVMHAERGGLVHRPLETTVRADEGADMFAQHARGDKGRKGQGDGGDVSGGRRLPHHQVDQQGLGMTEIEHEGQRGPEREQKPQHAGTAQFEHLLGLRPGLAQQSQAGGPFTLEEVLDPHEGIGPKGLEAEVAAKRTTDQHRGEEQDHGRDEQQQRQPENVLRVDRHVEQHVAPSGDVEHHCLRR